MLNKNPTFLGKQSTWGRLTLCGLAITVFMLAMFIVLDTRYKIYIPRMQTQCLVWDLGVLDKFDRNVHLGNVYAFKSRNMGIYQDGEQIAKLFIAQGFDNVEIDQNEDVLVNNSKKAHGLQLAYKLHKAREDFIGKTILENHTYFGVGTTYSSFDSRYWGAINENQIMGKLYRIF